MADISLSSILTAAQNIATALNNANQTTLAINGTQNAAALTDAGAVLVKSGSGRVATVSVLVAGAEGAIYDTNDATSTANQVYVIPAVVGAVFVNMPVTNGIVVAAGAAQVVTVSYS